MPLAMMIAVQTAQVAGPPVPAELRPVQPTPVARACGEADDSGDIVVCGRSQSRYRLERLDPDRYAEKPIRATTTVGKVNVTAAAEQGTLPNGQSSPRAMLHLKLPF